MLKDEYVQCLNNQPTTNNQQRRTTTAVILSVAKDLSLPLVGDGSWKIGDGEDMRFFTSFRMTEVRAFRMGGCSS